MNASNLEKDFAWLSDHIGSWDVTLTDLSGQRCRFAFQGPETPALMQMLVDTDLSQLGRFFFVDCNLNGFPVFVTHTGYTGEDGFEISCDNENAAAIWNALLGTGASPIGLGARDSLRLEACYSLYGHELTDQITPIEANIGWAVKPKEGIDFIGKDVLLAQKENGTDRILVGINLKESNGVLREHYELFANYEKIGYITSGGWAQTLKKSVGLALVKKEFSEIGTEFEVEIRNKRLGVIVVNTPFYKRL